MDACRSTAGTWRRSRSGGHDRRAERRLVPPVESFRSCLPTRVTGYGIVGVLFSGIAGEPAMPRDAPARRPYPSDLNGAEWALLAPLFARRSHLGRPERWPRRLLADAVFCLLRSGC